MRIWTHTYCPIYKIVVRACLAWTIFVAVLAGVALTLIATGLARPGEFVHSLLGERP